MKFKNRKGESIEINILTWDPIEQWITVKIKVSEPGIAWEKRAACLRLHEASELIDWLGSLQKNESTTIDFLEPELELHYRSGVLSIFLDWSLRPPYKSPTEDYDDVYALHFEPGEKQLEIQANSWKNEVNSFVKKVI